MEECGLQGCRVGVAIAEDDKGVVDLYRVLFEKWGIQICFIAYNGREAVKKFIECSPKPHVIIMDHRMPFMNGIEATKEIMKIDPGVKIIFLSTEAACEKEAKRAGAFMFLKKPAGIEDIRKAIAAANSTIRNQPIKNY